MRELVVIVLFLALLFFLLILGSESEKERISNDTKTHIKKGAPDIHEKRDSRNYVHNFCYNNEYSFTVIAKPENSRVRIMNIVPVYEDGICLKPGKYEIWVDHKGYNDFKTEIIIEDFNKFLNINLIPKSLATPVSSKEPNVNALMKNSANARAISLLEKLKGEMPQNEEQDNETMEIISQIVSLGPGVVSVLLNDLEGRKYLENSDIFMPVILANMGEPAVRPMIDVLKDKKPTSRVSRVCVEAFGRMRMDAIDAAETLVVLFNKLPEYEKNSLYGQQYLKILAVIKPEVLPGDVRKIERQRNAINKALNDELRKAKEAGYKHGIKDNN